jgi:site-specific DNA recombinase
MRAAIYARMSTDKQSADSPGDQIARCRTFAASRGWTVVSELVVEDAGVSGASRHNRPKLLELMARIPEWDVLLCWEFSRLARDSEDLGWIRNRLRVAKKTAHEVTTGLDVFNVGSKVMGILAEEYLVKLRADTQPRAAGEGGAWPPCRRALLRLPHRGDPERQPRPPRPQRAGWLPPCD